MADLIVQVTFQSTGGKTHDIILQYCLLCARAGRAKTYRSLVRSFARWQYSRKREAFNASCLFRSLGQGVDCYGYALLPDSNTEMALTPLRYLPHMHVRTSL
jgi:hypothetical protein